MNKLLLFILFFFLSQEMHSQQLKSENLGSIESSVHTKYAIIIGVSLYQDHHISLKYADSDAIKFKALLMSGNLGHFEPQNIKSLTDYDATYGNVSAAITSWLMDLREKVKPGDELYFFYSGHGVIATDDENLTCTNTKFI